MVNIELAIRTRKLNENHYGILRFVTLAFLMAGYLMIPATLKAAEPSDSAQITKLLEDAKGEAVQLKHDSAELEAFVKSGLTWETHARKVEMIKEHVNNTGKLLAKLQKALATRGDHVEIEPLLKELAANTETTINHLNENKSKIRSSRLKDYVQANYELASDLEALIRDFVDYGEAKQKYERLGGKLEIID